jgi:hypothetical protein
MNGKAVKVKAVSTDNQLLTVWLSDRRIISVPLNWYPSLATATPAERAVWQPSGAGRGVHWPALDYDLSVEGIIAGKKEHSNALHYTRETRARNQLTRKLAARGKRPVRRAATSAR